MISTLFIQNTLYNKFTNGIIHILPGQFQLLPDHKKLILLASFFYNLHYTCTAPVHPNGILCNMENSLNLTSLFTIAGSDTLCWSH